MEPLYIVGLSKIAKRISVLMLVTFSFSMSTNKMQKLQCQKCRAASMTSVQ